MTNEEKYKTTEERMDAFDAFCDQYKTCKDCHLFTVIRHGGRSGCVFNWLALEAEEEKPLPCPFCGGEAEVVWPKPTDGVLVRCKDCYSKSMLFGIKEEAIAAWNRRAK